MTLNIQIPLRLAEALLLKNGEISLPEIRSLPMVEDDSLVPLIADSLARKYRLTLTEEQSGSCLMYGEDTLRLIHSIIGKS